MYELFKLRPSPEVLNKIRRYPAFMSVRFVVEVDHVALRVELGRIRDEVLDSVDVRESFHAKLAVESATQLVEDLVFLLSAVPYIPRVKGLVGLPYGFQTLQKYH